MSKERNIILVDCFNTIFLRKQSPNDVLYSWTEKVGEKYLVEPAFIYNLFRKYRIKLCKKQFFTNGETEFEFDKALELLAKHLNLKLKKKFDLENFVANTKALYIETEQENFYLNENVINLLNKFKLEGKKIYLVSDFFCSNDVILKWFKHFEIDNLFTKLFVSCDYKKTKFSGKLYRQVIKELNESPRKMMMIGDNKYSDIFKARIRGIKAMHINTKYEKSSKDLKTKLKFGNNKLYFDELFSKYGKNYNYSNYAFPLYIFTKRLYENLRAENKKHVFFLSREGQFLKKLFDKYCEVLKIRGGIDNEYNITSHYLYASRNSLQAGTLKPLEEETFKYVFKSAMFGLSIRNFLITLTFTDVQIEEIAKSLKLNIDKVTRNFKNSKQFKALKQNKLFQEIYEKKRLDQTSAFKLYMESFGVDFYEEGLTIVDIGFNGTMQALFNNFFNGKVKIKGYYIGSLKKGSENSVKYGLLYDKYNKKQLGNSINYHNKHYYEQICRADHSRVDNYEIIDGKPIVIFDKKIDENKVYQEFIKPLQEQILDKFEKIANKDYLALSNIEAEGTKYYYKLVVKKSKQDVDWLIKSQDCYHDNFAVIGYSMKQFKRNLRRVGFKIWDLGFIVKSYIKAHNLRYKL